MDNVNSMKEYKTEINIASLIETARNCIEKDLQRAFYLINIVLAYKELDSNFKLQSLGIKSYFAFKSKNDQSLIRIYNKFIKKKKDISSELSLSYIRVLYRTGSIFLENKKLLLSALTLYTAQKYLENSRYLEIKDSEDTINSKMSETIKEISNQLNLDKLKYEKNVDFYYVLKEKITNSIKNLEILSENVMYYIISSIWIENLFNFIENNVKKLEKKFDKNQVCLCYFSERISDYTGAYPGPINNFFLIDFNEIWFDPDPNFHHTNLIIKKNLKEKTDYFILEKKDFDDLKSLFECYYVIERNSVIFNNEIMVEVNLFKFKVLILSDLLKCDLNQHLITPKNIQLSKTDNIKSLKEKLNRCINYVLREENQSNEIKNEIKIFNPNLTNKPNLIFELIYSFVNKNSKYKFEGEELIDENLILQDSKICSKDILIIEINSSNCNNWFLELVANTLECNICKKKLVIREFKCTLCDLFIYCSKECRQLDESHILFHNNLLKISKKRFNSKDMHTIMLLDILDKNSRSGLTGLRNLGNTCFMNSAIQCLSHTEDLTKYFLLKYFECEINSSNKYGTNGAMAKAYSELLKELWNGNNNYLSPWDFRQIFIRFAKQFAGFTQQDSHEMLTFVLDGLHEDLNRVKSKPYIELKERQSSESEEDASDRWWDNHLKRENSIIVDLFYGQYKSTITCPECYHISISYDPFMHLCVPLPMSQCSVKIKFFQANELQFKEIDIHIHENSRVNDIKGYIKASDGGQIIVIKTMKLKFKEIANGNENVMSIYDNNYELIFYDIENIESIEYYNFVLPTEIFEEKSYLLFKNKVQKPLFYPKPFSITKSTTIKDFFFSVFKYYRYIINDINNNYNVNRFYENINDNEYINKEFNFYLAESSKGNAYFKFHLINNIPEQSGIFSGKDSCEFCGQNCEYCLFNPINLNDKMGKIIKKLKNERNLLFYFEILFTNRINMRSIPFERETKKLILKKSSISIEDCFESFRTQEKLEKENAWYCPKCSKHQEAYKKMEIYRSPNILIVQLKRFKIKTTNAYLSMLQNKKNDCLIKFNFELNLSPFICGSNKYMNENIYELYAISQHYGSLSSGHYTALCKNKGKWYSFDDESVTKVTDDDIVTKAAYLLFYRRKNLEFR